MTPNAEQVKSAVRWLITVFGPTITAHGIATASTLEAVGGVVVVLVPLIWGMFAHTQQNAVAVVDQIAKKPDSPVKAVILEPTEQGRELAEAIPGNTTVVAGTGAAKAKAA